MPSPVPSVLPSETPANVPRRRTLLIVDDEEGPRMSLRVVFKDRYEIFTADNGPAALQIARQHKIDAAVLDIRMTGMSGTELLGHLKQLDPGIEVVMLTAYETVETARQALRHGACDYLTKPFEIPVVRASVANAMERRGLTEAMSTNRAELKELHHELETQKLSEEVARSRNEIYASVMHDIGSPLTAISVLVEMINMDLEATRAGGDTDSVREQLSRIGQQVHRCMDISKRYLNYSRERSIGECSVQINQTLTDVKDLLRAHPAAHKNQLEIRLLPVDAIARMNGTDLIQVLLNLTTNALQATSQQHKVELFAERLDEPLDLAAIQTGPNTLFNNREGFLNQAPIVAITVRDNGPGIPQDLLPKIFDSYFTTKAPGVGTGLGLAIVQRLVNEAKGALGVHSQPGQGTSFVVFVPGRA